MSAGLPRSDEELRHRLVIAERDVALLTETLDELEPMVRTLVAQSETRQATTRATFAIWGAIGAFAMWAISTFANYFPWPR